MNDANDPEQTSEPSEATVARIRAAMERVRERVRAALVRAGRGDAAGATVADGEDVTGVKIVGVTKRHPVSIVDAAWAAGVRHVGENYAQELVGKLERARHAGALSWHFIGHLQRNKAKYLVGRVALIHAVDSLALAREIARRAALLAAAGALPGGVQRVLVAVNTGGEAQKSGVAPDRAGELVAAIAELPHVECAGLMTMPPLAARPEDNRRYFRELAALRAELAASSGGSSLRELSMGTTDDFETAVEEGATIIRVGTAIFGSRPTG